MKTRVAIRPVTAGDQAAFVSAARASTALHAPWVIAPTDAAAFKRYVARFDGVANFGFVVYLPRTGELVGAINLTNVIFGVFRSGYLGYFAFAGFEGQGYMAQGLRAVVRHAFKELKLHRMEANIQPANLASISLVRACGFEQEGYSKKYLKIGGRWRDHERWALVKTSPH
jgi:[ribosomal protein S5]-alanine N-acetyltransferase